MKHLGRISADLFHRHFAQDAFERQKGMASIKSLKIVTYVPISALISTFKFIHENFIIKSDEAIIIFGVTGLNSKDSQEALCKECNEISKLSTKNLNVYIHTRCHIKMLLADNELFLGTQNISSTSCSFSEISHLGYNNIFSNHELIMKIHDEGQHISNSIINEIMKDELSCFNIIKNGLKTPLDYKIIFELYDSKTIKEYFKIIRLAADEIYNLKNTIDTSKWELEIEDCVEIVELCEEIHNIHTNDCSSIRKLSDFLLLVTGEDRYLRKELSLSSSSFNIVELLEKISFLSDINSSTHKNEMLNALTNVLTSVLSEIKVSDIDGNAFHVMLTKIKDVIFYAGLYDKRHLVEYMSHEVISQIESNIGDYELSRYIDNDANISHDSIQEAIYNDEIPLECQIYTLAEHVKKTSLEITEIILDVFKSITKDRIDNAQQILTIKMNNE
ncbi:hypothetical protein [Aeromonas veronii]|uniref:hypothetical protein n=1 Tax=Aeromonas veronii TaxID=654 RepID=UPI002444935B|nr:hypothetical protein [Aeromonas veronii]